MSSRSSLSTGAEPALGRTGYPSPEALLARHGLSPKKSFGQNFLRDAATAARIAAVAVEPAGGAVLEIGAGLGALTHPLLARAEAVVAVERDRDLVPVLRAEFAEAVATGTLRVVEADAKGVDVAALLSGLPRPHVLTGNLPYALTGPLLTLAVTQVAAVDRAAFLVQREVADRLVAGPGTPDYGALSVFVQRAFEATRAFTLRPGAFVPAPAVESAVVVLVPRARPDGEETELFRRLVHGAFQQRRKVLRNAWSGVAPAPALAAAAAAAGIDLGARGETLGSAAFAAMARHLEEAGVA